MSVKYRLIAGTSLPREAGPVIDAGGITMFWCPCGVRRIVIWNQDHPETKGHVVSYADDGTITIKGSVGANPRPPKYPQDHWCHAHMTDGRFELCDDSVCPGAQL